MKLNQRQDIQFEISAAFVDFLADSFFEFFAADVRLLFKELPALGADCHAGRGRDAEFAQSLLRQSVRAGGVEVGYAEF